MATYEFKTRVEKRNTVTLSDEDMRDALRTYLRRALSVELPANFTVIQKMRDISPGYTPELVEDGWEIFWTDVT